MDNQFTGQRFLVIECSDLGESIVEEYDVGPGQESDMREYLEKHIKELKDQNPDKNYRLDLDNEDSADESQQIQP